jgi:DNA-cytosine methyltransferase
MLAESMCGIGAENKEISAEMLKLPTCVLRNLVEGILSGDGSERDGVFRLTTVSKNLLQSLQLAIAKVYGVIGSVEFTKRQSTTVIEGRVVNQKDTYTISFRKDVKKNSHFRQIDNHIWTPVKSVDFLGELLSVFNLEVECDNNYTANNAVVHNCQGFSIAGKQLAFEDERSKLYFEFERILKEVNPTYFLLENVKMKQEYKNIITERLGVNPIAINSNLVSAQNRYRLYWTNIPSVTQPNDLNITLNDIIEQDVDEKYYIKFGRLSWLKTFGEVKERKGYIAFNPTKAKCLTALLEPSLNTTYILQWPHGTNKGGYRGLDGKTPTLTTSAWESNNYLLNNGRVRKLTPIECERLQTVPDGYTDCVSDTQRYKMLGNGWTVDVIAHILREM